MMIVRNLKWLCVFAIVVSLGYQIAITTFLRQSFEGDEGFYGTIALNMQQNWIYWLKFTPVPLGDFIASQGLLAHPCIHCILMAMASLGLGGGIAAFQLVPILSFLIVLLCLYHCIAIWDWQAGLYTVLLAAISPVLLSQFTLLEAEPLMAAAGMAGIFFALSGTQQDKGWRTFVAGLCLGFAFLTKLWLCFPYIVAAGTAILTSAGSIQRVVKHAAIVVIAFLLMGSTHLLAIAIFTPEDLNFWVRHIYFGIFTGEGISATKLLSNPTLAANWSHPFWYYFVITYRDHFFLFPLIALGLPYIHQQVYPALYSWIIPGILTVIPMSLFAIKEPLYILPIVLCLYALAGVCVSALVEKTTESKLPLNAWNLFVLMGCSVAFVAIIACYALGIQTNDITKTYVVLHSATMLSIMMILLLALSDRHVEVTRVIYASAIMLFGMYVAGDLPNRHPVDAQLALALAPYIAKGSPSQPAYLAPNFKSFQLYLFQRGAYWKSEPINDSPPATFVQHMKDKGIRIFIVGPEEMQNPTLQPVVRYLEQHAKEISVAHSNRRIFISD